MKLAIVGYGKMGRLIEQLAPGYDFTVAAKIDLNDPIESAAGANVAVEFSVPSAAAQNIERLAAIGVPVVVGTTGWFEQLDRVRQVVDKHGTGLVWSPNFSIGVNVFFRLAGEAARLMGGQADYGAWGWEIHHHTKKDAPSGTMLKIVEHMKLAGFPRPIDVSSSRAGAHPGTHEIGFDSPADTITLRHTARSREGFARGALTAAQWIIGKKGVHEFREVLFG